MFCRSSKFDVIVPEMSTHKNTRLNTVFLRLIIFSKNICTSEAFHVTAITQTNKSNEFHTYKNNIIPQFLNRLGKKKLMKNRCLNLCFVLSSTNLLMDDFR